MLNQFNIWACEQLRLYIYIYIYIISSQSSSIKINKTIVQPRRTNKRANNSKTTSQKLGLKKTIKKRRNFGEEERKISKEGKSKLN